MPSSDSGSNDSGCGCFGIVGTILMLTVLVWAVGTYPSFAAAFWSVMHWGVEVPALVLLCLLVLAGAVYGLVRLVGYCINRWKQWQIDHDFPQLAEYREAEKQLVAAKRAYAKARLLDDDVLLRNASEVTHRARFRHRELGCLYRDHVNRKKEIARERDRQKVQKKVSEVAAKIASNLPPSEDS